MIKSAVHEIKELGIFDGKLNIESLVSSKKDDQSTNKDEIA